jgi:hypothetical protein
MLFIFERCILHDVFADRFQAKGEVDFIELELAFHCDFWEVTSR